MPEQKQRQKAKKIGNKTGRDPVVIAAVGSVLLSWYQFYVRGNKMHGLFIGLWPPTLLALSNAVRINKISRKLEIETENIIEQLTES